MEGLAPDGFHCYDGHIHQSDFEERTRLAAEIMDKVLALKNSLVADGYSCTHLVMGGTPTFPCYAKYPDVYMAPGTVFLTDYLYSRDYPRWALPRRHHHDPGHQPPDPQHLYAGSGLQGHCGGPRRNPRRHRGNGGHCHARLPRARSTGYSRLRPAMRAKSRLWEASCL